jgi:hypothetical protein
MILKLRKAFPLEPMVSGIWEYLLALDHPFVSVDGLCGLVLGFHTHKEE